MKRKAISILFFLIMISGLSFSGCASSEDVTTETTSEVVTTSLENKKIDGYSYGYYDKYNSYAEDNRRGGDKIYIQGTVKSVFVFREITGLSIVTESDERWVCSFLTNLDDKAESIFIGKDVTCYGTYAGYSDVFLMPMIYVDKVDVGDNTYTADDLSNFDEETTAKATEKATEKPTEKATERATEKQTEKATEKPKSNISTGKSNALESAKSYLKYSAFSYQGLIEQLEYEKYSNEEAVYAADNCGADWNEQALKSAKSYLEYSSFSYQGLIDQLEYEEFTNSEATYGADNCGADWYEQAVKTAKSYLEYSSFSRDSLIDQLEYEGFTHDQAVYGVEQNGY